MGNARSGRKPKPTHLKVVGGTSRPCRRTKSEAKAEGDLFEPPAHFNDEQRVAWTYAVANAPRGVLKRIDQSVLAVWVVAWCMHMKATEQLRDGPHVLKTPQGGAYQSPWVGILNRSATELRAAASDLGFSPASRTRVSVPDDDGEDATDHYFKGA